MGATDAPVTSDEFEEVIDEMAENRIESCDVLGWESEMGLHYTIGRQLAAVASISARCKSPWR